ncbi:MAG: bifunctional riboflavin kinase/FAD synthetase [Gammaproteobacteria bacterium]
MKLLRSLNPSSPVPRACVATIGNFDGVHLGHQGILRQLQGVARKAHLPTAVIVFEPQPQEYFRATQAPARLTRLREKYEILSTFQIDCLVCLRFDQRLAELSAERFVEEVLVGHLGVRRLVVGDDFRFGHQRKGDLQLLCELGERCGFAVERADTFAVGGARVSSTRVRKVLERGDFEQAQHLLGRYYGISGRVMHGDKRGTSLGFPTVNINLQRRACALEGVFAVRVKGLAAASLPGAAYVGGRPTIDPGPPLLEVFVFDFDQECYGRRLHVEFITKLRADHRFDSLGDLRQQIAEDVSRARKILAVSQNTA